MTCGGAGSGACHIPTLCGPLAQLAKGHTGAYCETAARGGARQHQGHHSSVRSRRVPVGRHLEHHRHQHKRHHNLAALRGGGEMAGWGRGSEHLSQGGIGAAIYAWPPVLHHWSRELTVRRACMPGMLHDSVLACMCGCGRACVLQHSKAGTAGTARPAHQRVADAHPCSQLVAGQGAAARPRYGGVQQAWKGRNSRRGAACLWTQRLAGKQV